MPAHGASSGSRTNILSNKALAYLNSKKTNSLLKNYEEALGNPKFMGNTGKGGGSKKLENSQSNANFNNTAAAPGERG